MTARQALIGALTLLIAALAPAIGERAALAAEWPSLLLVSPSSLKLPPLQDRSIAGRFRKPDEIDPAEHAFAEKIKRERENERRRIASEEARRASKAYELQQEAERLRGRRRR